MNADPITDDDATPDDLERRRAIMATDDPETGLLLLLDFYRDADRADRTPRATLYLHLGLLTGMAMRILSVRK